MSTAAATRLPSSTANPNQCSPGQRTPRRHGGAVLPWPGCMGLHEYTGLPGIAMPASAADRVDLAGCILVPLREISGCALDQAGILAGARWRGAGEAWRGLVTG